VVGPSGSGKSTLVHLLLRFWEYRQGRILLDGRDLRRFRQEDVRQLMAVVSQNTSLFNGTLRDNLLLARPDATQDALDQAASRAQLLDFIHTLPDGYDTWVGEGGLLLSAGERQRVSIARALLKDAPLLVLDEATANLDALTEREVLRAIHVFMEGRATLMITHRLVGMEWMDEILVLHSGRIVEHGRHTELLALGGAYCRMWELQNQALLEDG
jgi:ATP-binding cassette subfamily C protein CydC